MPDLTSHQTLHGQMNYSARKLSTGFALAARITWNPMVHRASEMMNTAVRTNVHASNVVRYAKKFNHQRIASHANGLKTKTEIKIGFRERMLNSPIMFAIEPPITLRIPISFTLDSTM